MLAIVLAIVLALVLAIVLALVLATVVLYTMLPSVRLVCASESVCMLMCDIICGIYKSSTTSASLT